MKMIHKVIALILVLLMLLSVCGCKKDKTEVSGGNQSEQAGMVEDNSNTDSTIEDNVDSSNEDYADSFEEDNNDFSNEDFVVDLEDEPFVPNIDLGSINWDDGPSDDDFSDTEESDGPVYKVEDMFDNNEKTYWSPFSTETTTVEFSLEKSAKFNTIIFKEYNDYITDYIVEAKQSGKWVQLYRQDEMGNRTGVLDKTFTAKDFRLTVTMSDALGGISEISFKLENGFKNGKEFRNVGYYTASRVDWMKRNGFHELKDLTDIIIFDFGSFDKNGNFIWGSSKSPEYDEEYLVKLLADVKEQMKNQDVRIWFCLENYNKATTNDTVELFATEEARQNLTNFSIEICKKYGFYGVDIDYEFPWRSQIDKDLAWENFDKFLQLAGKELHKEGLKLSAALHPAAIQLSKETAKYLDIVNIMAYDRMDSKGRHSSYALVDVAIKYFTDLGFQKSQLIMGIPFYCHPTTEIGSGLTYSWIIRRWRNAIKPWTNSAYTDTQVMYFNGPYMVRDKVFRCMQEEVGGVFGWVLGADISEDDPRSLHLVVRETIKRFSK